MSYTTTNFYKDELNRLQARDANANNILNSKKRLAELNESYRKRYAKYVQMMMMMILAYFVYLALILLQNKFPVIPQFVIDAAVVILLFLVIIYLISSFIELYSRNTLNYDELDAQMDDSSSGEYLLNKLQDEGQIFAEKNTSACIGDACCSDKSTYDVSSQKCVDDIGVSTFTTLEYSKIDSAYTHQSFNDTSLKRSSENNAIPLQFQSVLTYSKF